MTDVQINELVNKAREANGFISITEYRSESGRIANLTVQPLRDDTYHKLVAESIQQVENNEVEKPDFIDDETWEKAKAGQIASWEKTLAGGHNRANNFEKAKNKAFYNHAKSDSIYIRNIMVVKKDIIVEGEFASPKSRPLTIAKRVLRSKTRIGKYQATLKLSPEKFSRVAFAGTAIDNE